MSLVEFLESGSGKDINCVIYKFTNIVNSKVYIGLTRLSFRKRVIAHISHSKITTKNRKHYFLFALQKYGISNFDIDILEQCSLDNLSEKEIYWINCYNATDKEYGYNCTFGGDGNRASEQVNLETRKLISDANKARWKDPIYKLQLRESRKKAWQSRDTEIVLLDYSYNLIKLWKFKKQIVELFGKQIYNLRGKTTQVHTGGYLWMHAKNYNNLSLPEPLLVLLTPEYKVVNKYYDYKLPSIKIHELTGQFGNLKFNLNLKFTKIKGTKKAGYIWMLYSTYKERINEDI